MSFQIIHSHLLLLLLLPFQLLSWSTTVAFTLGPQCIRTTASRRSRITASGPSVVLHATINRQQQQQKSPLSKRLTPAQRILQQERNPIKRKEGDDMSGFDQLKKVLYDGADTLESITKSKKNEPKIYGGYSEIERKFLKREEKTTDPLIDVILNGASATIMDLFNRILAKPNSETSNTAKTPIESLPILSIKRTSSVLSSKLVASFQPALKSSNPLVRVQAQWSLWNLEQKEKSRLRAIETQEAIRKAKETIYSVGDGFEAGIRMIQSIPTQFATLLTTTSEAVQSIPSSAQRTVDTVTSIPAKIQEKVDVAKEVIDVTVSRTQSVIDGVKDIPNKVEQTAQGTLQVVESTVQLVNEATFNTKVILGLEKRKPRPPKTPPPKPKTATDISLDVAGAVAAGTGKALWWVTKNVALLTATSIGKGMQMVYEQQFGKESNRKSIAADSANIVLGVEKAVTTSSVVVPPASTSTISPESKSPPISTIAKTSSETSVPGPSSLLDASKTTSDKSRLSDEISLDEQVREALRLAAEALDEVGAKTVEDGYNESKK